MKLMNELIFMSEPAALCVISLLFVVAGLAGGFGFLAGKDAQRKEDLKNN